ncbi:hypothetical protein MHU86_22806 [Fragilaria crotonensis]|nr:hypothetical protein MHU86_22806 [Fragilaria crotonensis]
MKAKLLVYKEKLVQLPAIVCAYLNPQIPKPTDPVMLSIIKGHIRGVLSDRYADKLKADSRSDTLFEALFANTTRSGGVFDGDCNNALSTPVHDNEVDRYLTMGLVISQSFIDIVQWWMARKDVLPAQNQWQWITLGHQQHQHCLNASTVWLVGSILQLANGCHLLFLRTMCLHSWMKAAVITIPSDHQKVML